MINPSAFGWIDKFFIEQKTSEQIFMVSEEEFYLQTRATGFIFGHIISFDTLKPIPLKERLAEEKRLRDDIDKRADSLVSDLKNADLLADDIVDKNKRNPKFFDNDYSAAVVDGTIEMFGTPEERQIVTGADAATKLKLAQRIGGEYRIGKRIPNTAEAAAKANATSLFSTK